MYVPAHRDTYFPSPLCNTCCESVGGKLGPTINLRHISLKIVLILWDYLLLSDFLQIIFMYIM